MLARTTRSEINGKKNSAWDIDFNLATNLIHLQIMILNTFDLTIV